MRDDILITAEEHKTQMRRLSDFITELRWMSQRDRESSISYIESLKKKLDSRQKTAAFNEQHKRAVKYRKAVLYLAKALAGVWCPANATRAIVCRNRIVHTTKKYASPTGCVRRWGRGER